MPTSEGISGHERSNKEMIVSEQLTVMSIIIGQSIIYYYIYEGLEIEFCKILMPKFFDKKC